jgi:tRNA(fMet)-specific endonuclease VapC
MQRRFLLDTNILSPVLRARDDNPAFIRFQAELSHSSTLFLCPVAFCEVLSGLHHRDPGGLISRFSILLKSLVYVELERQDWELAAKMRGDLMRKGIKISVADAVIAAQASRLNAIVVTDNLEHFKETYNLLEDWLKI